MSSPKNAPRTPDHDRVVAARITPGEAQSEALHPALSGRRSVLRGAGAGLGLVVGAGIVAACSSPPVQPAEPRPPSPGAAETGAGSTPGATGDAPPTSGATEGTAADVPVGGGKIFSDTKTVVTQPAAGTFKAFDTTCPHLRCAVTTVADGKINCPCHGSEFDISSGEVVSGPATTGLTPRTVTVSGDAFTVA